MTKKHLCFAVFAVLACALQAAEPKKYEAEELIVNKEAIGPGEKNYDNFWNLWSTDVNAKNWSGGKVIRSPWVKTARTKPEEGAPVLRVRIPVEEDGCYNIHSLPAGQRIFAISRDGGKNWEPFRGGYVERHAQLKKGVYEYCFDDLYAEEDAKKRGSAYLDYFLVQKENPLDWLKGENFETGKLGEFPTGWSWFHREGLPPCVKLTDKAHSGKMAAHLVTPAGKDWAFSCTTLRDVKPGECFRLSFWAFKNSGGANPRLSAVAYQHGRVVRWDIGAAGTSIRGRWHQASRIFQVPEGVDQITIRFAGEDTADFIVDDLALEPVDGLPKQKPKPKIEGFAKTRIPEKLGRGVYAQQLPEGAYISWRLLKEDPADVAFDVYRVIGENKVKLNAAPITGTCDYLDEKTVAGCSYLVQGSGTQAARVPSGTAQLLAAQQDNALPYRSYKLTEEDKSIQKIGIGDLDGDGELDFVVKYPRDNVDPWNVVWYASKDTYKLEAFRSTGERLWRKDLGWSIEAGIWYSPYIVYDFNGDGCAEVAVKTGEGDPRDEMGYVQEGPEWLSILDGKTGKEIAKAPWPSREPFDSYNHASRNLLAVGYLDGKTPCILMMRGTYTIMFAQAWQLNGNKLEKLWEYDNQNLLSQYQGQGAHTNYCVDVDGDGRDEVILGSIVLDDSGDPLWTTGKGHPDGVFYGDILPSHPGPELGYFMETRNPKDGICLVDPKTGTVLWGLQEKTSHVDGKGTCADVDPRYPGSEMAGADMAILEPGTNKRGLVKGWLFTSDGKLLHEGPDMYFRFGRQTIWWDADLQKEIFSGRSVQDYRGYNVEGKLAGSMVQICDVIGDWREEVITTLPGEFRVYSTPIPAMDRRVCLMQCHNYRMRQATNAMGYTTEALLDYDLETEAPNLSLIWLKERPGLEVTAVASAKAPVQGKLFLEAPKGIRLSTRELEVSLKPGERMVTEVQCVSEGGVEGRILARWELGNGKVLKNRVSIRSSSVLATTGYFAEAENFVAQSGGEVHIRSDKPGVRGKAFSHWDNKGHRLAWEISVPKDGNYKLVIRYSCTSGSTRQLWLNGQDKGLVKLPSTWGFGDSADEWENYTLAGQDGNPLQLNLKAGKFRIELENADGKGTNLDYIVLQPYSVNK